MILNSVIEEIEKQKNNQQDGMDCYLYEDLLKKTEIGELPYDNKHPLWGDQEFLDEFIIYLIEKENFELCEKYKSIKNNFAKN